MRLLLNNVSKSFGSHRVLDAITADFGELRTLAFIGPSGGGKATLLRILAGLETPDSGTIEFDGQIIDFGDEPLRRHTRALGIVFQSFNLFPHLTALENITLPLEKVHALSTDEARDTALAALRRFRLEDHAHKRPAELSGGL